VVTGDIETPAGRLRVMAELEERGRTLILHGLHVETDLKVNSVGIPNLRALAQHGMDRIDYDELIIEGAIRTTGAGHGRLPGRLRFTRRDVPAPRDEP
jgi:hypothetical protein